jgi:hypothetical protein
MPVSGNTTPIRRDGVEATGVVAAVEQAATRAAPRSGAAHRILVHIDPLLIWM